MAGSAKRRKLGWPVIVWFSLPVFIGLGFVASPDDPQRAFLIAAVCGGPIFLIFPMYWLAIAVHEAGHVIAGLFAGFTFNLVEVLNVSLAKTERGLSLRYVKNRLAGGFAHMSPPAGAGLLSRYRLFILGGPLASVIYVVIAAVLCAKLHMGHSQSASESLLDVSGLTLLATSIMPLFGTLIPYEAKGFATDTMLLWRLRKPGPEQVRLLAITQVSKEVRSGLRARDWTDSLIDLLAMPEDRSVTEIQCRYLRYYKFADRGLFSESWDELAKAASICSEVGNKGGFLPDLIRWEQTFAAAWWLKDLKLARSVRSENGPVHEFAESTHARALAAIALLEGRREDAIIEIERSRASSEEICKRLGSKPSTDGDWLDAMLVAARSKEPPTH